MEAADEAEGERHEGGILESQYGEERAGEKYYRERKRSDGGRSRGSGTVQRPARASRADYCGTSSLLVLGPAVACMAVRGRSAAITACIACAVCGQWLTRGALWKRGHDGCHSGRPCSHDGPCENRKTVIAQRLAVTQEQRGSQEPQNAFKQHQGGVTDTHAVGRARGLLIPSPARSVAGPWAARRGGHRAARTGHGRYYVRTLRFVRHTQAHIAFVCYGVAQGS